MRKHIGAALKILTKIFSEGTYGNMALYGENVSDMTAKLVYGVLDENVKLEYVIGSLTSKKPQNQIFYLLKIGAYALLNLTDVPAFAIVSECVEVAKSNGKGGASGFVNAVLKKVAARDFKLPSPDDKNYYSVIFSKPQWFVDKMFAQYGVETTLKMFESAPCYDEHIRVNTRMTGLSAIKDKLSKAEQPYRESEAGGLLARVSDTVREMFNQGLITFQSASSVTAVKALAPHDGAAILDLCSAPGGKAVYASELCPHSVITACDVHLHRLELIKKYAKRMRASNVAPVLWDAQKLREDWLEKFDYVLVDAPCSCFGTYKKHPDVFLSRDQSDIGALADVQASILDNACRYVKSGGVLLYSTCTTFYEENGAQIARILKRGQQPSENDGARCEFKPEKMPIGQDNDGTLQIMPHGEWDGFYIARLRRL